MEIELKYKLNGAEQIEQILTDEWLGSITENDQPEILRMKAAYFDTEDHTLIGHNIALLIRTENEHTVATLKWRDDDDGIGGLYIRSEINIPVTDKTCFFYPDPKLFEVSPEGKDLLDILEGKPLINIFDMIFTRKRFRIDYKDSILELAIDEGVIVTGSKSMALCEMEIEVYSGNKDDLLEVGKKIAKRYGLEPELKTKFARGIELSD